MPLAIQFKTLTRTDGYSGNWQGDWTETYDYLLSDGDHNPNVDGNWTEAFVESGPPGTTGAAVGSWIIVEPSVSRYPVANPQRGASLKIVRAPFAIQELDRLGCGEENIAEAWANMTFGGLIIQTTEITFGAQDGSSAFDIQLADLSYWGWRTTPTWGGSPNPFPPVDEQDAGSVGLAICAVPADLIPIPIEVRGPVGSFEAGKEKAMDITHFVKGYLRYPQALMFEKFPVNPQLELDYFDSWGDLTVKAVYAAQVEGSISWTWTESIEGTPGNNYWLPYGTITQVAHAWETVDFGNAWVWLSGATLPAHSRIPPGYIPRQTPIV